MTPTARNGQHAVFRRKAERHISKTLLNLHALAILGQHYRGHFDADDAMHIVGALRGAIEALEQSLLQEPACTRFAWPGERRHE